MVIVTKYGLKRPIEGPGFVLLQHIPSARDFRPTPKREAPKAPKATAPAAGNIR